MSLESTTSERSRSSELGWLLADERFVRLVRDSSRSHILWGDFLQRDLPEGLDAPTTWELLCDVRSLTAFRMPFARRMDCEVWYTPTLRLEQMAKRVESLCQERSYLSKVLASSKGSHFRVSCQLSEIIAATTQDGLFISKDRAHDVVCLGKIPRLPEERLVANIASLMDELDRYGQRPFSDSLVDEMADRILEDVDLERVSTRGRNLVGVEDPDEMSELKTLWSLDSNSLWDYANDLSGESYESPVVKALNLRTMASWLLFDHPLCVVLAQFVSSIYALRHGIPALAVIPVSAGMVDRIASRPRTLQPFFAPSVSQPKIAEGARTANGDFTFIVEESVEVALEVLEGIISDIEERESCARNLGNRLKMEGSLNYRQYAIVEHVLRNPEAEMTISRHRNTHRVAYATARADFLNLVEKGYLRQYTKGKAHVFVATRTLLEAAVESGSPGEEAGRVQA